MSTTPASTPTRSPWQQRRLPYPLKFIVTSLAVLLGYVAFMFGFAWLMGERLYRELLSHFPGSLALATQG